MKVSMLRSLAIGATAAVGLALVASSANAQAQTSGTRFGLEAAYANHYNLGVGAFVKFHLTEFNDRPLTGRVSFDYYFPGDYGYTGANYSQKFFQVAGDALYDITASGDTKPYIGAGVVYSHYSVDCSGCYSSGNGGIGLDIMGGLNFMANSKLMPFVEAKLGLGGSTGGYGNQFVIKGGIHF